MPDSTKVVRYGRHEFLQHEDTSAETIRAGYLVEVSGGEVSHLTADGTKPGRFLVAKDDRDRGMELGDEYDAGDDACKYLACSGGGVHLYLADGESVSDGDALVSAGDGTVRAAAGDGSEDGEEVAYADEDRDASGEAVAIAVEVAH